jgi:hypothetical protein
MVVRGRIELPTFRFSGCGPTCDLTLAPHATGPAAFSDYLGVEAMGFVTAHPRWRAHQSAVPGPIMGISHTCVSGSGGTSDGIVSPVAPQRQQQPGRVATRQAAYPAQAR